MDKNNIDSIVTKLNIHVKNREQELINKYGQRYITYREEFEAAGNFEYEPDFPLYIMPEQTYKCNLHCISCVHGYKDIVKEKSFKPAVMPIELYKKIVLEAETYNCPSIATHNNDEPMLVPDIAERIAFAREHGFMDVIMTTNATLFTEKKIKEVIDAGVTKMLFSIDSYSEKTYNNVRAGGNFTKAVTALNQAIEYRKAKKSLLPIIRVSFVVNSLNEHELEDFILHYSKIVDFIDIQPLFMANTNAHKSLIAKSSHKVSDFRCNALWRTIIVRGNGDVLPCPNFAGVDIILGNVYEQSIYEIYNSKKAKRIRQEGKTGKYSETACISCANQIYSINKKSS